MSWTNTDASSKLFPSQNNPCSSTYEIVPGTETFEFEVMYLLVMMKIWFRINILFVYYPCIRCTVVYANVFVWDSIVNLCTHSQIVKLRSLSGSHLCNQAKHAWQLIKACASSNTAKEGMFLGLKRSASWLGSVDLWRDSHYVYVQELYWQT